MRKPEGSAAEERNCAVLEKFWGYKSYRWCVHWPMLDHYVKTRLKEVKKGDGFTTAKLELITLRNAIRCAFRTGMVKELPPVWSAWPKVVDSERIKHCRDFVPANIDEVHGRAKLLFACSRSAVLGWLLLFLALFGVRRIEAIELRRDAAGPDQPGWLSKNGALKIRRRKRGLKTWAQNSGPRQAFLRALFAWLDKHYPDSPWYFPSPLDPTKHIGKDSLARALGRQVAKRGWRRKVIQHALRAFYVTVRLAQGATIDEIRRETGHKDRRSVEAYDGWDEEGPDTFEPTGEPAWNFFPECKPEPSPLTSSFAEAVLTPCISRKPVNNSASLPTGFTIFVSAADYTQPTQTL